MKIKYSVFIFILFWFTDIYAQKKDTVLVNNNIRKDSVKVDTIKKENFYASWKKSKISNPRTAVLLSAALPGLGQIYNKKHAWFGLVTSYAAIGTTLYIAINNTKNYNILKTEYKYRIENNDKRRLKLLETLNTNTLKLKRDAFQKSKEQSYFAVAGAYLYCIGEAFVTAHLRSFDVSDDISLQLKPSSTSGFGVGFLATF